MLVCSITLSDRRGSSETCFPRSSLPCKPRKTGVKICRTKPPGSPAPWRGTAPTTGTVSVLRRRLGLDRPIMVCHIDRPSNDFNSLFELLDTDPHRYGVDDPYVFPCAIGRSFYGSVLPPNSVDIGWSSFAAMWLSRVPALISNHFYAFREPRERSAPRSSAKRRKIGKHSSRCGERNYGPAGT